MTTTTTNFGWVFPAVGDIGPGWATQLLAGVQSIDTSLFVEHAADGTHKALTKEWDAGTYPIRSDTIRADTTFSKNGTAGLIYVRSDKDGDGLYNAYTSTSWDGDLKSTGTGTIDWVTVFGVPNTAKAVELLVVIEGASFPVGAQIAEVAFYAKSTSTTPCVYLYKVLDGAYTSGNGTVPVIVTVDGETTTYTSYYSITATDTIAVKIYVTGYFI